MSPAVASREGGKILLAALRSANRKADAREEALIRPPVEKSVPANVFAATGRAGAAYDAITKGLAAPQNENLGIGDAVVKEQIRVSHDNRLTVSSLGPRGMYRPDEGGRLVLSPDAPAVLRNFVRAAELGAAIEVDDAVWLMPWPATPECGALLRRAAQAFAVAEDHIPFGNGTLADPNSLGRQPPIENGFEASEEVGRAVYSGDFGANAVALSWGRPVPNAALLCFDDRTVRRFVESFDNTLSVSVVSQSSSTSNQQGVLAQPWGRSTDAMWMLRNFVRAAELGSNVTVSPEVWQFVWPATPQMAALLRRAANAFDIDPSTIRFGGGTLAAYDPLNDLPTGPISPEPAQQTGLGTFTFSGDNVPFQPGEEESLGGMPYGTRPWNADFRQLHENLILGKPVYQRFLALDDPHTQTMVAQFYHNTLHGTYLGPGTTLAPEALTQLRNFVRAAELGNPVQVMPDVWLKDWPATTEVAALLLRAVDAFELNPKHITLGGRSLAAIADGRRDPKPESTPEPIDVLGIDAGFDPIQSVLNFYPSFETAKQLAQHPVLASGVESFVDSLGIPADVAPVIDQIVNIQVGRRLHPETPPTEYADRRVEELGLIQGFSIATGPLSTDSDDRSKYLNFVPYHYNKAGYFRDLAIDENLSRIGEQSLWSLHDLKAHLSQTPPEHLIEFVARRLELDDSQATKVRTEVTTDFVGGAFGTDDCVPALLRLARASRSDIDRITMNDGSSLRQRALAIGLRPQVRTALDINSLFSAATQSTGDRIQALTRLTSTSLDAPAFDEIMKRLLPLIEANALEPISFDARSGDELVAALINETHPLAIAAFVGLFLAPTAEALTALKNRLPALSETEFHALSERITQIHQLSPKLRGYALAGLAQNPPALREVEMKLNVLKHAPFTAESVAEAARVSEDLGGVLRTMFEVARLTGASEALSQFVQTALQNDGIRPSDLFYALANDDGAPSEASAEARERAYGEVLAATTAVRQADVVTQGSALHDVVTAVLANASVLPPAELVRAALASLYAEDIQTVAPLGSVEAQSGDVKGAGFIDGRSLVGRLNVAARTLDLTSHPLLAQKLELLKARIEIQHATDDTSSFAQAAVKATTTWLQQQTVDSSFEAAVIEHIEEWAASR
jgi:hypothetical protein